jgi:hypothetical protein
MPLVLSGATSGSATVQATDGQTVTITLPSTTGTLTVTGGSPTFATLTVTGDASISGLTVGKGGGSTSGNTIVGYQAQNATNGNGANCALGYQSLYSNLGYYNIGIGYTALYTNTSGISNIAIGQESLYSTTTGNINCALGTFAMRSNTTGSNNVGIGGSALFSNTTASYQTAVGYQAGYNTTGNGNCFFGYQSGLSNTTGVFNAFFGRATGTGITTGYFNTIIGDNAGVGFTTGSVTNNTFLGASSGNAITSGSNNSILGCYTGNQGGLDIRTSNNYIVLSDGNGNPRVAVNPSGYLKAMPSFSDVLNIVGTYHELVSNDNANNTLYVANKATSMTTNGMVRLDAYTNTTNNSFYVLGYYNQGAGAYKLRIADSGTVTNATGTYGTISDAKLKENIVDATPKLDDVMKLKVRNFNLKSDPNNKQIGFIAQEFEQVFPSMVEEHKDSDPDTNEDLGTVTKSIKTSILVPMLVKAIQELNAKVEAQAAQIAALTGAK